MKAFVPKYPMGYPLHTKIVAQLIAEGMHDGKAWKDAAFSRYNDLEELERVESGGGPAEADSKLSSPPVGVDLPVAEQPACQFDSQANNSRLPSVMQYFPDPNMQYKCCYCNENVRLRDVEAVVDSYLNVVHYRCFERECASPPVAPKEKL